MPRTSFDLLYRLSIETQRDEKKLISRWLDRQRCNDAIDREKSSCNGQEQERERERESQQGHVYEASELLRWW